MSDRWIIMAEDLEHIAIGAGILGTGGGGNPYNGKLHVRRLVEEGANIEIQHPESLADDALVTSVGGMGAPTVSVERIARGDETVVAMRALEEHIGQRFTHVIPGEIGGSNAMRPMATAALTGLPVVDGDGMGRAFPELQMDTFSIAGVPISPAAIADIHHNTALWTRVNDPITLERQARAVTIQMGGSSGFAFPVLSGGQVRQHAISGTMTLAREIGKIITEARNRRDDPVAALCDATTTEVVFAGKIVDVERRLASGFARGQVGIEGVEEWRGSLARIDFQNENLILRVDGEVRVIVPDLISIIDSSSAEPVTTELLRYGLRVTVVAMPAPALLKTEAALEVVGPRAFGYDVNFNPMPGIYGLRGAA